MECVDSIIQLPAANPPPCPRTSIDRSLDRSIDRSLGGGSHGDPRSMKNHGKLTQESFQNRPQIDRKRAKTMKHRSSGTLRGAQGTRGRKLMENCRKSDFADPPRRPVLGHLGDIGHHLADIFSILGWKVDGPLDDRRFDGKSVRKWTAKCG